MKKVIRLGSLEGMNVYCRIEFKNDRLSFSGVVGPLGNGDCRGSCGQVIMSFREYDKRGHLALTDLEPAPGWDHEKIRKFFDCWDRWHLNDMRAGTPKQEEFLRDKGGSYEENCRLLKEAGIYEDEGYKYGHAWLTEEVPAEVLTYLESLPDTDRTPAWV